MKSLIIAGFFILSACAGSKENFQREGSQGDPPSNIPDGFYEPDGGVSGDLGINPGSENSDMTTSGATDMGGATHTNPSDMASQPSCVPNNVAACAGKNCGTVVNNCNQTVSCGAGCASGYSCQSNVCTCVPQTVGVSGGYGFCDGQGCYGGTPTAISASGNTITFYSMSTDAQGGTSPVTLGGVSFSNAGASGGYGSCDGQGCYGGMPTAIIASGNTITFYSTYTDAQGGTSPVTLGSVSVSNATVSGGYGSCDGQGCYGGTPTAISASGKTITFYSISTDAQGGTSPVTLGSITITPAKNCP